MFHSIKETSPEHTPWHLTTPPTLPKPSHSHLSSSRRQTAVSSGPFRPNVLPALISLSVSAFHVSGGPYVLNAMSFYIRKSLNFGPIRFNLSKTGVGVSAGIKGFRIGSGPKGNYVHVGRGGIYYRASLSRAISEIIPCSVSPAGFEKAEILKPLMLDVESAAVGQIVDASSQEVVNEIREKTKRHRLSPWIALLGMAATLFATRTSSPEVAGALAVLAIVGFFVARTFDANRKTTVIFYDFEDQTGDEFKSLH